MFVPDYNIGNYEVEVDDENLVARVIYSPTGKPIEKFKGETAWSDARRHANDMHFAMGGK
jgi:hypothetical protein